MLKKQLEDYKSVIKWAKSGQRHALFRPDKVVAMGSAISGLHVAELVLDAEALGIAGGMAHCPYMQTTRRSPRSRPTPASSSVIDCIAGALDLPPALIRAVGTPDEFAFINSPSSYPAKALHTPFAAAPNLIAPRVAFEVVSVRPGLRLKDARCPFLDVMAADNDLNDPELTPALTTAMNSKVQFVVAPGGHFSIMKGGETNINAQIAFLQRYSEEHVCRGQDADSRVLRATAIAKDLCTSHPCVILQ
ncbi:hypothetical protein FB451DRAFT_1418632 [Mycena latifolia]|nr:hypothetical protein FB451DRAFT_1418632 [Mycena latifolia]